VVVWGGSSILERRVQGEREGKRGTKTKRQPQTGREEERKRMETVSE
jgi:hypothetical protein